MKVLPTSVPVPVISTAPGGWPATPASPELRRAGRHRFLGVGGDGRLLATRSRLVPAGTVGGRMAGTSSAHRSKRSAASNASLSLPIMTGMMGVLWPGRTV